METLRELGAGETGFVVAGILIGVIITAVYEIIVNGTRIILHKMWIRSQVQNIIDHVHAEDRN